MSLASDWRAIRDQQIPQMFREGDSVQQICRTFELGATRVREILRKAGVLPPPGAPGAIRRDGITEPQRRVLQAFAELEAERGRPPFLREVAERLDFWESTILAHLKKIAPHGYVVREQVGGRRWWRLTTAGRLLLDVPCPTCGRAHESADA